MIEVKEKLADAQRRKDKIKTEIEANGLLMNELQQKRQLLLQELLRLDGEVRALESLNGGGKDGKT